MNMNIRAEIATWKALLALCEHTGDEMGAAEARAALQELVADQRQRELVQLADEAEARFEELYEEEYTERRTRAARKAKAGRHDTGNAPSVRMARRAAMREEWSLY